MKKFLILIILILACGCSATAKRQIISFNVRSIDDVYTYGNLKISIDKINNDCVLNRSCKSGDKIDMVVYIGESYQREYGISTNKYVKIDNTDYYAKVDIKNSDAVISIYEED